MEQQRAVGFYLAGDPAWHIATLPALVVDALRAHQLADPQILGQWYLCWSTTVDGIELLVGIPRDSPTSTTDALVEAVERLGLRALTGIEFEDLVLRIASAMVRGNVSDLAGEWS